jgi:hypothetical protein
MVGLRVWLPFFGLLVLQGFRSSLFIQGEGVEMSGSAEDAAVMDDGSCVAPENGEGGGWSALPLSSSSPSSASHKKPAYEPRA